jgi:hypothetical protein
VDANGATPATDEALRFVLVVVVVVLLLVPGFSRDFEDDDEEKERTMKPGGLRSCSLGLVSNPGVRPGTDVMNANSTLDEVRKELAKLQAEHEILAKSYRELVLRVIGNNAEAQHFLGQMAVDRVRLYPHWLKTSA